MLNASIIRLFILTVALMLFISSAYSQVFDRRMIAACNPLSGSLERLTTVSRDRHGEKFVGRGMTNAPHPKDPDILWQVYAKDGGGFIIFFSYPDGETCLVAAGDSWEFAPEFKGERP